jgi:hypothetical protein
MQLVHLSKRRSSGIEERGALSALKFEKLRSSERAEFVRFLRGL